MPKAQKLRRHHISVDPYKKFDNSNNDIEELEQQHLPLSIIGKNKKKKGNDVTSISSSLLSELEATLQASATTAATSQSIKPAAISSSFVSHKITKEVAIREATRMKLVQQLPGFDLVALHKHLDQMTTIKQKQGTTTTSESQTMTSSRSTKKKSIAASSSAKKNTSPGAKIKSSSSSSNSGSSNKGSNKHEGKTQSKKIHKKGHK